MPESGVKFLKRTAVLTAVIYVSAVGAGLAEEPVMTLEQAYRMALKVSETIGQKQEAIEEAQGHFYQAMNLLMPDVEFVMTRAEQDVENGNAAGLRRTTPTKKITITQPLFSGFKEFAAIAGSKAEKAQKRHEKKRAEELLWLDVADAYYTLLEIRKDIEILDAIHKATEERIAELKERENLGRSRTSEVQSAISDLKLTEAERITSERIEKVAKLLFEFYIGQPLTQSLEDAPDDLYLKENQDISAYLAQYDRRSDVIAAEEAYRVAVHNVAAARAGFFPDASLDANVYTHRAGSYKDVDWDTTLTVNVPIFDAMQTVGDVKVAAAKRQSAKLELSLTKRRAQQDIQSAYEVFYSSLRSESAFLEAAKAAEQDYQSQVEEYRLSLVNNLQVLDALRQFQSVKRRHNVARYGLFKNYWQLKVAAGQLPE